MAPDDRTGEIRVEVVYALPETQSLVELRLSTPCTVAEAIERSGLRETFPGMTVDPAAVGIFGQKTPMNQELQDGDRVEIYRPLIADPKEVRRQRAKKSKEKGSRAG